MKPDFSVLPTVADETFEQAATRLHSLLDDFLSISRTQNEADSGLRLNTSTLARKIDGAEYKLREGLAETCRRVAAFAVNPLEELMTISNQGCIVAPIKAINDLGVAKLIPTVGDISIGELAVATQAEENFLERLLRSLASYYIFTITAPGRVAHSKFSAPLCDQTVVDLMLLGTKPAAQTAAYAPDFWREHGYKNPVSAMQVPFQKAHNTDLPFFEYINTVDKDIGQRFDSAMAGLGKFTMELTLDTFPFDKILQKEGVIFVDVGGGTGHMVNKIHKRWSGLNARMIVQDQPQILGDIPRKDGNMELQGQDFFTEQPVKGANYYFLRRILHDWSDHDCARILGQLVKSMIPGKSKILIADFVMPEIDTPRYRCASDIMMAILLGGAERSERQWRQLFASVDIRLYLEKIWAHDMGKEFVLEVSLR